MTQAKYDILIVGCGLLGNIAALVMGYYGLKVIVVEKKSLSDTLLAKSARVDEEVMLVFEQMGWIKELKEILHPHYRVCKL